MLHRSTPVHASRALFFFRHLSISLPLSYCTITTQPDCSDKWPRRAWIRNEPSSRPHPRCPGHHGISERESERASERERERERETCSLVLHPVITLHVIARKYFLIDKLSLLLRCVCVCVCVCVRVRVCVRVCLSYYNFRSR